MDSEQRGAAAFRRLQELLDDLAYDEEAAINYVFDIAGKPAEIGEKAIKQWFSRKAIPAYAIFNLAEALGVDVTWLAGSDRISKEKAILKGGPYHREIDRVERIRADFAAKRPRARA